MKKGIIIISTVVCLFSSCITDIDLNTKEEMPIGLFCILRDSSVKTLNLFHAKSGEEDNPRPISDAEVRLFEDERMVGIFEEDQPGYYHLGFTPEYGHQYHLIARLGETVLTAKTEMPDNLNMRCRWITKHGITPSFEIIDDREVISKSPSKIFLRAFMKSGNSKMQCNLIGTSLPGVLDLNRTNVVYDRKEIVELEYQHTGLREWSGLFLEPGYYHDKYLMIRYPKDYSNGIEQKDLEEYGLSSSSAFFLNVSDYFSDSTSKLFYDIYFLSDSYAEYLYSVYYKVQNRGDIVSALYDKSNFSSNVVGGFGLFGAEVHREVYPYTNLKY